MTKRNIRLEKLQLRKELTSKQVNSKSKVIAKSIVKNIDLSACKILHSFLPIKETREVNTFLLVEIIKEEYPNILIATFIDNNTLESVILDSEVEFEKDGMGIPVPTIYERIINLNEIDVILIPCLAFDKKGYRIGYGRGSYDNFLSKLRPDCLKVGVCFNLGLVENSIEFEDHDKMLDYIITESEVYNFNLR